MQPDHFGLSEKFRTRETKFFLFFQKCVEGRLRGVKQEPSYHRGNETPTKTPKHPQPARLTSFKRGRKTHGYK